MTTHTAPQERAQQAAGTASDEGRHLAGVTQNEASNVASEAADQARQVVDDAVTRLNAQSRQQKDRLAGTVRKLGDDLESMSAQASPGLAADVTRQVSGYARSFGDHLHSHEPGELIEDVRRFARRHPGTFLLGALAGGVVAGRLARGVADGAAGAKYVQQTRQQAGTTGRPPTATTPGSPGSPGGAGTTGTTGTAGTTGTVPTAPAYPGAAVDEPYLPDPQRTTYDGLGPESEVPR